MTFRQTNTSPVDPAPHSFTRTDRSIYRCDLFPRQMAELPNKPANIWGPIHRHCPKIYLKTCHKIILWQKLRCHKMILRHILCQFTKFVLGDLKYSQDMTRCHSNNHVRLFRLRLCIMILTHVPIFYPFVSVPVPPFDQRTALPQYGL